MSTKDTQTKNSSVPAPEFTEQQLAYLQQQHADFVLSELQGDVLRTRIDNEVSAVYGWLNQHSVNDMIDAEQVKIITHHVIKSTPITERFQDVLTSNLTPLLDAELNRDTRIQDVMTKTQFDDSVQFYAQFEAAREAIIEGLLNSPLYSQLISDLLYHGIRDYLTSDALTKKVPGMSSIMKIGGKSIGKAMSSIESIAEGPIKRYIETNINRSLEISSRVLNNALCEDNVSKVADRVWENNADKPIETLTNYVNADDIKRAVALSVANWEATRELDYLHGMVDIYIDAFFAQCGTENAQQVLVEFGYDSDTVKEHLSLYVPGIVEHQGMRSLLDERVNDHMARFYGQFEPVPE